MTFVQPKRTMGLFSVLHCRNKELFFFPLSCYFSSHFLTLIYFFFFVLHILVFESLLQHIKSTLWCFWPLAVLSSKCFYECVPILFVSRVLGFSLNFPVNNEVSLLALFCYHTINCPWLPMNNFHYWFDLFFQLLNLYILKQLSKMSILVSQGSVDIFKLLVLFNLLVVEYN